MKSQILTLIFLIFLILESKAIENDSELNEKILISNEKPTDRILNKLDKFISATKQEISDNKNLYDTEMKKCQSELEFRKDEMEDGKEAFTTSKIKFIQCSSSFQVAKKDLINSKKMIMKNKRKIIIATNERKIRVKIFEKRKNEHEETLEQINKAYQIIEKFENSKELVFVQIANHINDMFILSTQNEKGNFFSEILISLSQLSAQTDDDDKILVSKESLQNLVDQFENFENNVKNSLEDLINEDEKDEKAFQTQIFEYNEIIKELEKLVIEQIKYIKELKNCIITERGVRNEAKSKFNRNTRIRKTTVRMCKSFKNKYIKGEKKR